MKNKVVYMMFLFIIAGTTSCKKEFPDEPLSIKDLSVSDCKTKGGSSKGIDPEYITLKTVDDYYLLVNHINSMFNCEPGQITISIEVMDNEFTLDENESSSSANCICPYDLEFKLGPIEYGTYYLKFQKGSITFREYTLSFKRSTDVRIDL